MSSQSIYNKGCQVVRDLGERDFTGESETKGRTISEVSRFELDLILIFVLIFEIGEQSV